MTSRILIISLALVALGSMAPATTGAQEVTGFVLVDTFPHDPEAFTQGLDFWETRLFESTGLEGHSTLRRVDLASGDVLRKRALPDRFFGEGMTVFKGKIYQLTWTSQRAFVYRPRTFEKIGKRSYEGEGWGLTHNGRKLIMSDGTEIIRFRDPGSFEVTREIRVTDAGLPVSNLNELEWVEGEIFANVWQTDDVVRIDPESGEVVGRFNLASLRAAEQAEGDPDVANGIAYMASEDRLFVTGKFWAHIYEIELTE